MRINGRRWYAVYELLTISNFSAQDRQSVQAFSSPSERDAWVRHELDEFHEPLLTRSGTRRAVTRREAARYMREIMDAAFGGRQSGYEALAEVRPEWHEPSYSDA